MLNSETMYIAKPSLLLKMLRAVSWLIPIGYSKTRTISRAEQRCPASPNTLCRTDRIWALLRDFRDSHRGNFSVLELGTSSGYSFGKMLYAARHLGMENRLTVHAFDSFEGGPSGESPGLDPVGADQWVPSEPRVRYEHLRNYCAAKYRNFRIHQGNFAQSMTEATLEPLRSSVPILVWIDCSNYGRARTAMERLTPYLPSGCVFQLASYDHQSRGIASSGGSRLVHEINRGAFGENLALTPDKGPAHDRIYRFMRVAAQPSPLV